MCKEWGYKIKGFTSKNDFTFVRFCNGEITKGKLRISVYSMYHWDAILFKVLIISEHLFSKSKF